MKETLRVLNELKKKRLIEDYAIGGGIATIFYTEPVFTYDLDAFVIVKEESAGKIISLSSIYDYLRSKGCPWKGEHIVIGDLPVQFIPATSGLEREAIENAKVVTYGGIKTKVFTAEFLIAIALKVGRRRDFEKMGRLLEQAKIDKRSLEILLQKYRLLNKFKEWEKREK